MQPEDTMPSPTVAADEGVKRYVWILIKLGYKSRLWNRGVI